MELNKIKLFDKAELLQKLKQSGFTEVVGILEDKEINGEKLINLREFEIFKWKLSSSEKKCLWDCIKEIKAKPYILLNKEKPKVPKKGNLIKSSSFSQNDESTNSIKGKLENLLGTSATNTGSASTLPNKHSTNLNNVNKNVENNVSRKKPLPPLPNGPRGKQSDINQKPVQTIANKPALPLPEKSNHKNYDSGHPTTGSPTISNSLDIPSEYMDMQSKTNLKKVAEDEDYLTPNEVSGPATNFKNSGRSNAKNITSSKRGNARNTSVAPPPPPLPNKNINVPKRYISKEKRSGSSDQINLPTTESQKGEDEDWYEPPPRIGNNINVHRKPEFSRKENQTRKNVSKLNRKPNKPAGANPNVVNTNKFSVEVITDDTEDSYDLVDNEEKRSLHESNKSKVQFQKHDESDDIYEPPPALKPKIISNKYTGRADINSDSKLINMSESVVEAEPTNAKKPSIKDLENVIIVNEKETQGAVLTKFTSTISNFFRAKRSKHAYENHSIISTERHESVIMPTQNRPLPETPIETNEVEGTSTSLIETTEQNEEEIPTRNQFSRPFPLPRDIDPVPCQPGEYVKLIPNLNAPSESLPTFTSKQVNAFDHGPTYSNITEIAQAENRSHFTTEETGRRQQLRGNESNVRNEPNTKVEEEITDYENSSNHHTQTPHIPIDTDRLASLLANELRKRNLLKKEYSQPTSVEDSDFEDEDNDQPIYNNSPTPDSDISTSQGRSVPPNSFLSKVLPTYNVTRADTYDDDPDQPVYGNSPTPIRSTAMQRASPLTFKTDSPTRNTSRVETEDDDDDDDDNDDNDQNQPVYGNSPTPTKTTAIQKNNELSPNPIKFQSNLPIPNISRVDKRSHAGNDDDFNNDNPSYGNIPEAINPLISNINTHNQRRNNLYPNSSSTFANKTLPSASINSSVIEEKSKDANISSHGVVEEKIPIYKRKLPDTPKKTKIISTNSIKNSTLNARLPIKNRHVHTPSSSDEEDIDNDNITYGNIDESIPTFKKPSPITSNKILNTKSKKVGNGIEHTIRLNHERHMVNKGKEEQVTVNEGKEEDHIGADFINNIHDEPYYRNTDRKGAKLLLQKLGDGAFLFRPSYSNPTHFLVLTVKHKGKFYNLGLERSSSNKIRLNAEGGSMAPEFASLSNFINYFKKEPVTFEDNKGVIVEIFLNPVLPPSLY